MKRKRDFLAKTLVLTAFSVPLLANQLDPRQVTEYEALSAELGYTLVQKISAKKFLAESTEENKE